MFKTYRPVLKFIITFLVVYVVLSFSYSQYLHWSKSGYYQPDFITYQVAYQTEALLNTFGYASDIKTVGQEAWVRLYFNDTYVIRIIEGCNAVSVIILFAAFIIAFTSTLKRTLIYLLFGSVLIYITNVIRIAFLSVGLFYYPEYEHVLHGVIFPLLIYGMVFLLWVIWVNYFVIKEEKDETH